MNLNYCRKYTYNYPVQIESWLFFFKAHFLWAFSERKPRIYKRLLSLITDMHLYATFEIGRTGIYIGILKPLMLQDFAFDILCLKMLWCLEMNSQNFLLWSVGFWMHAGNITNAKFRPLFFFCLRIRYHAKTRPLFVYPLQITYHT